MADQQQPQLLQQEAPVPVTNGTTDQVAKTEPQNDDYVMLDAELSSVPEVSHLFSPSTSTLRFAPGYYTSTTATTATTTKLEN